jgi:hypothetical protein
MVEEVLLENFSSSRRYHGVPTGRKLGAKSYRQRIKGEKRKKTYIFQ